MLYKRDTCLDTAEQSFAHGGLYFAKTDSAKSETAVQESAKPYSAKPHSANPESAKTHSGIC